MSVKIGLIDDNSIKKIMIFPGKDGYIIDFSK